MKQKIILLLLIITNTALFAQSDYYWYKGDKIFLEKIPQKKFILLEDDDTINNNLITDLKIKKSKLKDVNVLVKLKPYKSYRKKKEKWMVFEDTLSAYRKINNKKNYVSNFFYTPDSLEVGLSHLFYVRLKRQGDLSKLARLAAKYNVEILGNDKFMPLWYTLACSKNSKGDALQMANLFYETNLFIATVPDFILSNTISCVNDDLFDSQWNLNNTGQHSIGNNKPDINYCEARQVTTGHQDIIIAVIDHGIDFDHPDLTNIYPLSLDSERDRQPSVVVGSHGTACAGIIGANADNDLGVAGIAPDCPLMSISNSLTNNLGSVLGKALGINWAWQNGASVISNSWWASQNDYLDEAIDSALTSGRDGLGCVIVFSTHNDDRGTIPYPPNSNKDIIAVGAISPCGERKSKNSCDGENWGSNYGSELDIMAPGVFIPTTDRPGSWGYNHAEGTAGDYYPSFNGTSSACPHVAAVAGLILSVNPHLTQKQVSDIIESTAQKIRPDKYDYGVTTERPNGTWNEQMGYGLLDAYAAVQAACSSTYINKSIDEPITTNTTVKDCEVTIERAEVQNAKLTIKASKKLIITGSFKANVGSELEFKNR